MEKPKMKKLVKRAIYPGSFDPVTMGHIDITRRALKIFDELVIAVARSEEKKPMFELSKRVEMLEICFADEPKVVVKPFDGLLVNFAKDEGTQVIVRGLRAVSDFEYELQMGYANQYLDKEIETLYLMPSLKYAFVSSSVVRTILKHCGDVGTIVPSQIADMIKDTKCM
jgi:pantetheine-phosphate adenylyltransferase